MQTEQLFCGLCYTGFSVFAAIFLGAVYDTMKDRKSSNIAAVGVTAMFGMLIFGGLCTGFGLAKMIR